MTIKERPISLATPMIKAFFEGQKRQIRVVIKDWPHGIINAKLVPKKAGDIHWFYNWDCKEEIWDQRKIVIQQGCFCFEGEIERYNDPCDIAKGTKLFPYQSSPYLCPYGQVGDRLWGQETWQPFLNQAGEEYFIYAADYDKEGIKKWKPWRPSTQMPRKASRILLEIIGIRVERLQDISKRDAMAEGIDCEHGWAELHSAVWRDYINGGYDLTAIESYKSLWQFIKAKKHPWDSNPWVWVIDTQRI